MSRFNRAWLRTHTYLNFVPARLVSGIYLDNTSLVVLKKSYISKNCKYKEKRIKATNIMKTRPGQNLLIYFATNDIYFVSIKMYFHSLFILFLLQYWYFLYCLLIIFFTVTWNFFHIPRDFFFSLFRRINFLHALKLFSNGSGINFLIPWCSSPQLGSAVSVAMWR